MKHHLIYLVISKWRTLESKTKKKFLVLLGVFSALSVVAIVMATILLFKAGGYLFNKAVAISSSISSPLQTEVAEAITAGENPEDIIEVQQVGCSNKLKSLIAFDPWINIPLSKTFESIISSCFPNQKSFYKNE